MSNKLIWLWLTLVIIGCKSQIISQPQNIPDLLNDKRTQIVEAITSAERVGVIDTQNPGSIDDNRSQGEEVDEPNPEPINPEENPRPEEISESKISTEENQTTGDTSEIENSPDDSNQNPDTDSLTPEGDNGADSGDENGDANGKDEDIVTNTTSGTVKGHKWRENADIIGYIDIPYGSIVSSPFAVSDCPFNFIVIDKKISC